VVKAAVGLGSNLGDRARNIADAVAALSDVGSLYRVSSLYETAPIGGPKQGPFLNAVAVFETELAARALLERCLDIERESGRERRERWGPRTLDLDILLYGNDTIEEPDLTVPHPRMTERRFVLDPLLEVWPDVSLPDGTPLSSFAPAVASQRVRKLEKLVPDRRTSAWLFVVVALAALAIWWLGDFFFG
jgi:2-amino-4-hydroxy-6-hydroxymethyldihydropteridine diphosphokinase